MKASSKVNGGSILRQGSITSTNQLGLLRRMPDMEGTCPLLLADLSDEMGLPSSLFPMSVSAEVIQGREQSLYSFRLQVGAKLVCWLANPFDPEILRMLQTWCSVRYMSVGLRTVHGVYIQTRPIGGTAPSIDQALMAQGAESVEPFIRSATDAVASGLVKAHAISEIASVPKIRRVRVFLIQGKEALAAADTSAD